MLTLALNKPKLMVEPAQLRTSVAKRFGSGLSLDITISYKLVAAFEGGFLTIVLPLIPIMKSNQGSRGTSARVLRRTWKPNAPCVLEVCSRGPSSRRAMNLLSAPNMFPRIERGDDGSSMPAVGIWSSLDVAIAPWFRSRYFVSNKFHIWAF